MELVWISYSLSRWKFSCSLSDQKGKPRPKKLCWLISQEFSPFKYTLVLRSTPNHIPLKCKRLIKSNIGLRHIYLICGFLKIKSLTIINFCHTLQIEFIDFDISFLACVMLVRSTTCLKMSKLSQLQLLTKVHLVIKALH